MVLKSKHGLEALVDHKIKRQQNGLHVIEVKALCGKTVETHNITIGADDGPRKTPKVEDLQAQLDMSRQEVADEAAWKESVRLALKDLK